MSYLRRIARCAIVEILRRAGAAWYFRSYFDKLELVQGSPELPAAKGTLLALNPGRFRGELELLAANGFRVVEAPYSLQTKLLSWCYQDPSQCLSVDGNSRLLKQRKNLHSILTQIFERFFPIYGIEAVVSAAIHYKQDIDWGLAAEANGYPYIVLHRENLVASVYFREIYFDRTSKFDSFKGSKIFFHNEAMRKIHIDSGYSRPDQVVAAGAMRMAPWISRCRTVSENQSLPKQITLFSFGPASGFLNSKPAHWPASNGHYFHELCEQSHIAMAGLAERNPDVPVVIKAKWAGNWPDNIRCIFERAGIELEKIPNLRIAAEEDAQELIFSSSVVIGFNSTTLLEASLAKRHVIIPMFAETSDPLLSKHIMFGDAASAFVYATSPLAIVTEAERLLNKPTVGGNAAVEREALFSEYVSPLSDTVCDDQAALLRDIISDRKISKI